VQPCPAPQVSRCNITDCERDRRLNEHHDRDEPGQPPGAWPAADHDDQHGDGEDDEMDLTQLAER
jgi:hypothetical protein